MTRPRQRYQCESCGTRVPKWTGQCPDCGAWNSLVEIPAFEAAAQARTPHAAAGAGFASGADLQSSRIYSAHEVSVHAETHTSVGIGELDRVLGGGLVSGAVVLIGGDPGIGKSTLLLQTLACLAQGDSLPCLYVTGEESLSQVLLRARRLGLVVDKLRLLAETRVEQILALACTEQPKVMVVDSIQTMYTEFLQSAPGSVSQVRESAARLVRYAKDTGISLFLVGHVTKEGAIAGPRVLEHMVDTVLYFESEDTSRFRVVRAIKNRFGAVNELGIFAMTDKGLKEVANPSAIFLSRYQGEVPGSVITVIREGTRPLLVEVQALVDESALANPRRVAVGLDQNRLTMLLGVLNRHGGTPMHHYDVFLNVVGGVRVSETGADLPVLLAVLSSLRNRPLPTGLVAFGEVGLAGEIRPVPNGEDRLREVAKHGFTQAVIPKANQPRRKLDGLDVQGISRLGDALTRI